MDTYGQTIHYAIHGRSTHYMDDQFIIGMTNSSITNWAKMEVLRHQLLSKACSWLRCNFSGKNDLNRRFFCIHSKFTNII